MGPRLVIMAGCSRELGQAYLREFSIQEDTHCIGISRSTSLPAHPRTRYVQADLENKTQAAEFVASLDLPRYESIIYIHGIGSFKFELDGKVQYDDDQDGIDDEVHRSNVGTYTNMTNPLIISWHRLKQRPSLTISAFGSLTDLRGIPHWVSYSSAKNKVRDIMRKQSAFGARGVMFSISSVQMKTEMELRPHASTDYWLLPEEIVERSTPHLPGDPGYSDIDLYNHQEGFDPHSFWNPDRVRERWIKEMGGLERVMELMQH